jgi:hypothetical protein
VDLLNWAQRAAAAPRVREVWGAEVAENTAKWLVLSTDERADADEIDRLVRLDVLSYERERKKAADRLGIDRVAALDRLVEAGRQELRPDAGTRFLAAVEPWPKSVDGADLLKELCDAFRRHVVLSPSANLACALWTLHAHAHDAATHGPVLDISSPTKRCGKTQLLGVAALVPKPLPAANVTAATVFRAIERWNPTLLIDEMDTFLAGKSELLGVLNSGHDRRSAFVLRCVGDESELARFSTWCPKVFAHIGRVAPTLEDRSIRIELGRRLKTERIERMPRGDAYAELRLKCARWAADSLIQLSEADPEMPASLNDRAADSWRPLLAIADACGFGEKAREAALKLSEVDDDETDAIILLRDLANLFDQEKRRNPSAVALATVKIGRALAEFEDRKWPEFRGGKPITPTQLALLLKPFKIYPRKVPGHHQGHQVQGYRFEQFETTFRRYLGEQAD